MPRRQPTNPNLLRGEIAQWRRPEWRPIMELVGDLTAWFMWMGELELEDGSSVHSYKHRSTRRYVHLGVDGQAYDYVSPRDPSSGERGRYRPTTRSEAHEEAFFRWDDLHHASDERDEVASGLGLARHVAATDGRMTFDVDALARQRRFDLACEAARRDERQHDPGFSVVRRTADGEGFIADLLEAERFIESAEERALRKVA